MTEIIRCHDCGAWIDGRPGPGYCRRCQMWRQAPHDWCGSCGQELQHGPNPPD